MKVSKVVELTNNKTLGTSVMNSPMSPPSRFKILYKVHLVFVVKWIHDIRGYYDRGKMKVNLGC